MDGADDALAVVCELSEELYDLERRLTIETRSRLVQEQEHRLRYEFDTDRDTFALFDTKTCPRFSDQCIGDVVQLTKMSVSRIAKSVRPSYLQHINDSVDVGKLLRLRRIARLTKKSTEREGLADGLVRIVDIHL